MTVSHQQKIGTYFKKENIFLATVSASDVDTKELLKSKMDGIDSNVPEDLMAFFSAKVFSLQNSLISFTEMTRGIPAL